MSSIIVFIILIVFILLLGLLLAMSKKQHKCKINIPPTPNIAPNVAPNAAPISAIEDFDPTKIDPSDLD
jgi:hypothetical protein